MSMMETWRKLPPGTDMYEARRVWIKEGKERWEKLTEGWSEEDRKWAENFWMALGMPWG